jgi:hypothetical protein
MSARPVTSAVNKFTADEEVAKMKLNIAAAAVAIAAFGLAGLTAPAASAVEDQSGATTIGVYRWDAWHGGTGGLYQAVKLSMQPSAYADKLPFFAETNPVDGSIEIDDTDAQWKMDAEIDYAAEGGVDYWAFLHYSDFDDYHSPMNESFARYMDSSKKSEVGFCFILSHELMDPWSSTWDDLPSGTTTSGLDHGWKRKPLPRRDRFRPRSIWARRPYKSWGRAQWIPHRPALVKLRGRPGERQQRSAFKR